VNLLCTTNLPNFSRFEPDIRTQRSSFNFGPTLVTCQWVLGIRRVLLPHRLVESVGEPRETFRYCRVSSSFFVVASCNGTRSEYLSQQKGVEEVGIPSKKGDHQSFLRPEPCQAPITTRSSESPRSLCGVVHLDQSSTL